MTRLQTSLNFRLDQESFTRNACSPSRRGGEREIAGKSERQRGDGADFDRGEQRKPASEDS